MTKEKTPKKAKNNNDDKIIELTEDLQRIRADFENYRKRTDIEKEEARLIGRKQAILTLLPVIDNIERAIAHRPKELETNPWAEGVANLVKNFEKSLSSLSLSRIDASAGTAFDPRFHEAIQFDDESSGTKEVITEELQPGYMLGNTVIRHAMVKVTMQD